MTNGKVALPELMLQEPKAVTTQLRLWVYFVRVDQFINFGTDLSIAPWLAWQPSTGSKTN